MDAWNSPRRRGGFVLAFSIGIVACGPSAVAPVPPPAPTGSASTDPVAPPLPSGSAQADASPPPAPSSAPAAGGDSDSAAGNAFAAHVDEAKVAKELGAENGKLLQIAKLSPKTHKSLLKNHLYSPLAECKA